MSSLIEITRTYFKESQTTEEVSYYISPLDNDVERISQVIGNHWQIESHYWVLDVTFREDESSIYARGWREKHGAI